MGTGIFLHEDPDFAGTFWRRSPVELRVFWNEDFGENDNRPLFSRARTLCRSCQFCCYSTGFKHVSIHFTPNYHGSIAINIHFIIDSVINIRTCVTTCIDYRNIIVFLFVCAQLHYVSYRQTWESGLSIACRRLCSLREDKQSQGHTSETKCKNVRGRSNQVMGNLHQLDTCTCPWGCTKALQLT